MKTTFFEPDRPDAIWTVKQVASVIELHIDQRAQTFSSYSDCVEDEDPLELAPVDCAGECPGVCPGVVMSDMSSVSNDRLL